MSAHIPYRRGTIPAILILLALGYWWLRPHPPRIIAVGYITDRNVALWNTLAQVRQPIEELHYGDRVEVVRQEGMAAQVRTVSGALGWLLDMRQMMDPAVWERSVALLARARTMPVQARGRTKTVSNVRVEAGRNGRRIFQFMRGTPVVVLERAVADAPQASDEISSDEKAAGGEAQKPKLEGWLFVLRAEDPTTTSQASLAASGGPASKGPVSSGPSPAQTASPAAGLQPPPIAGWVLARFIELDLPGPVRDYATSADLHVVAWFELNRVPDGSGGEAPQYLVAASRSGEGQSCDFTMLRVYTWSTARKRYETAYVESNLCGHLPIRMFHTPAGPQFNFAADGENAAERTYVMQQTVIRRLRHER
jgi:hypothetical protein